MIENANSLIIEGVHLMEDLVSSFRMAAATDVEILAKELFTSVAVHIHIRQFLRAEHTEEVPCAIAGYKIVSIGVNTQGAPASEPCLLTGQGQMSLDLAMYSASSRLIHATNL